MTYNSAKNTEQLLHGNKLHVVVTTIMFITIIITIILWQLLLHFRKDKPTNTIICRQK